MSKTCPHCGAVVLSWHGVRLQRRKMEIVEAVEHQPISLERLIGRLYPGIDKEVASFRIRTHVHQINEMMVETDWRIRNIGGLYTAGEHGEEEA